MFWAFEKIIFESFASFWVTKLKAFSGKVRQSVQVCLNQTLVIGTILENGFAATSSSKTNVVNFLSEYFSVFSSFWVRKLKLFCGKVKQSVKIYFNQNLSIRTFWEIDFGATLSSKTNVLSVLKEHYAVFCKFLSDKVETYSWESETNHSKLFKSKFGHKNLLRKWIWSNLELKNKCCERFKRAFSSLLQVFEWRRWNHFLRKLRKVLKSSISKFGNKKLLTKWFWSNLELKNESCERFKCAFFSFLQGFEWRRWNLFLRKLRKVLEFIWIKIWA